MTVDQAVALSNKAIERALGERPVVEVGVVGPGNEFKKL
jgi:proteasome alpha subunit